MKRLLAVLCLIFGAAVSAQALASTSPVGLWRWLRDGKAVAWVFVIDRAGVLDGFIVKAFPGLGGLAGDEARLLIRNMRKDGPAYSGGTLTDPRTGKAYPIKMALSHGGKTLSIRGTASPLIGLPNDLQRLHNPEFHLIEPKTGGLLPKDAADLEAAIRTERLKSPLISMSASAPTVIPTSAPPSLPGSKTVENKSARGPDTDCNLVLGPPCAETIESQPAAHSSRSGAPQTVKVDSSDEAACRDRMKKLGVVANGPCIDVSDIIRNLSEGDYSFNNPKQAYVREPFTVRLLLETSDEQSVKGMFNDFPGEVVPPIRGKFAQSLEATLRGDDFSVSPSGPVARTATMVAPVVWEWKVTPLAGGKKTLLVEVAANIQAGPDKHRVQIITLSESIVIEVSTFYRVKAFLAEANGLVYTLAGTITALITIFGFAPKARSCVATAWNWFRRKPRRNGANRRAKATHKRRRS